jgi:hypothetical protein
MFSVILLNINSSSTALSSEICRTRISESTSAGQEKTIAEDNHQRVGKITAANELSAVAPNDLDYPIETPAQCVGAPGRL